MRVAQRDGAAVNLSKGAKDREWERSYMCI